MVDKRLIDELELTLNSVGYKEVIGPTFHKWMLEDLEFLSALKRPEGVSDDFLRGRIDRDKTAVGYFPQLVKDAKANAAKAKSDAAEDEAPPVGSPYANTEANLPSDKD